jgi:hypothetical protein
MSDILETIKPEPDRDRWGRYLITPAGGGKPKAYTRATTIADTLDDRYNLELWKIRMAALGLVERPDLYASIASLPKDDKAKINGLCDKAIEAAKGSAGANLGTALHRFTERINRGHDVVVPAPWDADIAAYQATLNKHGLVVDRNHLERIVVLEQLGIAGTFDLILNGRIADLKTGATLDFSWNAITIQLAIYAHADTLYDPVLKIHEPMPSVDQDVAYVIHLPAGQGICTLYRVDIKAGWEAAQQALWVRSWRKRKNLAVPVVTEIVGGGQPAPDPATVEPASPTGATYEGGPADPVSVAALKHDFDQLDDMQRLWIADIFREAKAAGRSLSVALDPTQRKYWIGCGLVELAANGCDRQLLAAVLTAAFTQPTPGDGAHTSLLTVEQAAKFAHACTGLRAGDYSVIFNADGSVHIQAA